MNKSESIASLCKALVKAQSEVENASKNSNNPHFKSKYADLAEVLNTVRPVFTSHGLSFVQMPSFSNGVAMVETILLHESGEWIGETAAAPVTKQDAQGVGSAITYLRRYSLAAFAGIAQEDDDGTASVGKAQPAKQQAAQYETVSATDVAAIRQALAASGRTEQAALAHWKLEALDDMPKSWLADVLNQLKPKG